MLRWTERETAAKLERQPHDSSCTVWFLRVVHPIISPCMVGILHALQVQVRGGGKFLENTTIQVTGSSTLAIEQAALLRALSAPLKCALL
jgi:hypothetical protein